MPDSFGGICGLFGGIGGGTRMPGEIIVFFTTVPGAILFVHCAFDAIVAFVADNFRTVVI